MDTSVEITLKHHYSAVLISVNIKCYTVCDYNFIDQNTETQGD